MNLRKEFEKETNTRKPMTRTHEAYAYYYEKYSEWLEKKVVKLFAIPDVSGSLHLEFAEWISSLCISNFKSGGTWYLPDGSFKTTEQLWRMFLKQRQ